jgi:hypothetical protein
MIYVTEIQRTYVARDRLVKVVARVSTKPYDNNARRRSFTPNAWDDLCARRDVRHYHPDGVYRRGATNTAT